MQILCVGKLFHWHLSNQKGRIFLPMIWSDIVWNLSCICCRSVCTCRKHNIQAFNANALDLFILKLATIHPILVQTKCAALWNYIKTVCVKFSRVHEQAKTTFHSKAPCWLRVHDKEKLRDNDNKRTQFPWQQCNSFVSTGGGDPPLAWTVSWRIINALQFLLL